MQGIIIYKGKYGATRQYAAWLRNELRLHLVLADHCKEYQVEQSDVVIIGSSIYVGKMQVSKWLNSHISILKKKRIFLFVVCGTPASETEKLQAYFESSVPPELRSQCRVYYLPGRMVYKKLSFMDKLVLRMGAMLAKDPVTKKRMLTDYDAVKKENLDEILQDIKSIADIKEKTALQQY